MTASMVAEILGGIAVLFVIGSAMPALIQAYLERDCPFQDAAESQTFEKPQKFEILCRLNQIVGHDWGERFARCGTSFGNLCLAAGAYIEGLVTVAVGASLLAFINLVIWLLKEWRRLYTQRMRRRLAT